MRLTLPLKGQEGSLRDHLNQVQKSTGHRDPRLDSVQVPIGGERLWNHFWRLYKGSSVSYVEIEAYCRMTGAEFDPWEVEVLMSMEAAAGTVITERLKDGH